jgi:hypothetical protein
MKTPADIAGNMRLGCRPAGRSITRRAVGKALATGLGGLLFGGGRAMGQTATGTLRVLRTIRQNDVARVA